MNNTSRLHFAHLPTPIEELPRLSDALGGPRLLIKRDDQTGLAFGGNKTRKLEFLIAEALDRGARTLISGGAMQSNHCRQTAAAAARFGLECICVTFGEQGAIAWHNGKQYRHAGYKVKVADTVGSGDAFLASFLAGYLCGYSFSEILNKACPVGAFLASRPGANPQYVEEEVIKIGRSQKMTSF